MITIKDLGSIRGVVFLLMSGAVIIGFFMKLLDPKDFFALASMAFVAYFTRGRDAEQPVK